MAKKCPGHSIEKLHQDQETRVDEVFGVCDSETIRKLYEEFPKPFNHVAWLFTSDGPVAKSEYSAALRKKVGQNLLTGIRPKLEETPKVYKVEHSTSGAIFRCVASDREERLPLTFLESESVKVLSYYDAVIHFSEIKAIVFGPYSGGKAIGVLKELDSLLEIDSRWTMLKPATGQSREFYKALKRKIGALLVETKRHERHRRERFCEPIKDSDLVGKDRSSNLKYLLDLELPDKQSLQRKNSSALTSSI